MKTKNVHLQVDLTSERNEQLTKLMAQTGLSTREEFFNNALTLTAWAIREVAAGRKICSQEPDGSIKELSMWMLDNVVRKIP